jgi:hypothetical protein
LYDLCLYGVPPRDGLPHAADAADSASLQWCDVTNGQRAADRQNEKSLHCLPLHFR